MPRHNEPTPTPLPELLTTIAEDYADSSEATYCLEDDKLRIYAGVHLERADYLALKREGFKWSPKQECDFVAHWTPTRARIARAFGSGYLGDEDYSPEERAADKAQRIAGYQASRMQGATAHADAIATGEGYQSQAKADQVERRNERHTRHALDQWGKAEYWQSRRLAIIKHAQYKQQPGVRERRLRGLEADRRRIVKDYTKARQEAQTLFDTWQALASGHITSKYHVSGWTLSAMFGAQAVYTDNAKLAAAFRDSLPWGDYYAEQRTALEVAAEHGPDEAAEVARKLAAELTKGERPADFDESESEYCQHLALRIEYEEAMLEAEGGRLAKVEMEKGGTYCGHVVHKVNKSQATKLPVSVSVLGSHAWKTDKDGTPLLCLVPCQIDGAGPEHYQPPTPESLAKLEEQKVALNGGKAKPAPIVNPTFESAKQYQQALNKLYRLRFTAKRRRGYVHDFVGKLRQIDSTVEVLTKEGFSSHCRAFGRRALSEGVGGVVRLRLARSNTGGFNNGHCAPSVVALVDAKQKPFPPEAFAAIEAECEKLRADIDAHSSEKQEA